MLLKIKTLISTNLVTTQLVLLLKPNVVSWYDFYQYFISLLLGVVVETCGSVVSVLFRRMEMISGFNALSTYKKINPLTALSLQEKSYLKPK